MNIIIEQVRQQLKATDHQDAEFWVTTVAAKNVDKLTQGELEHILDFFNSDDAPKRLRRMSVDDAKRLSHEWTQRLIKKGNKVIETEEDVEVFLQFDSGFRIVKLVSENAYKREGSLMAHCVGSYHGNERSVIYSLRDSNNKPHATMEVERCGATHDQPSVGKFSNTEYMHVNQIKGKGNGSIHPRYIEYVLGFLNEVGLETRDSEMANLGYVTWSEDTWKLIDTKTTGAKTLTVNGKRYFYVGSNLELVDACTGDAKPSSAGHEPSTQHQINRGGRSE